MAQAITQTIKQPPASHHLLVGLPLALILGLSIAFVMVHPAGSGEAQAKVSQSSHQPATHPQPVNLTTIPAASPIQVPSTGNPQSSSPSASGDSGGSSGASHKGNSNPQSSPQNTGNDKIKEVVNNTAGKVLGN